MAQLLKILYRAGDHIHESFAAIDRLQEHQGAPQVRQANQGDRGNNEPHNADEDAGQRNHAKSTGVHA